MRPSTGRILLMIIAVVAAIVVLLWWSDTVLVHKCHAHGGIWDRSARVCRIPVLAPTNGGVWT